MTFEGEPWADDLQGVGPPAGSESVTSAGADNPEPASPSELVSVIVSFRSSHGREATRVGYGATRLEARWHALAQVEHDYADEAWTQRYVCTPESILNDLRAQNARAAVDAA